MEHNYNFKYVRGAYHKDSKVQLYNAAIQALRTKLDAWVEQTVIEHINVIHHLDVSVSHEQSAYKKDPKIRISLDKVEVFERDRQQGVGKAILQSLLRFAQQEQRAVELLVTKDTDMQWLRDWYERLGFRYHGQKGICIYMLWTPTAIDNGDTTSA